MKEITITQPAGISFDFESAKAELEAIVEPYKSLVFTEDTKKDAKETVAQLRKSQKDLNDRIKTIKKEYMKPFDEFSAKAMELVGLYDEPICFINDQVKAFDEARKEEKKKLIADIYADIMGEDEVQNFIPLAYIYNNKWENATATKKQIAEDIMNLKLNAKNGLETIKSFHSDKEDEAIALFKKSFDIAEAIGFIQRYEQQKAEILKAQEERARQAELERVRAEERAKIEAEQKKEAEIAEAVEQAQAETIEQFIPDATDESEQSYTYLIKLTESGKHKLEMFMDSVGIEYEEMVF